MVKFGTNFGLFLIIIYISDYYVEIRTTHLCDNKLLGFNLLKERNKDYINQIMPRVYARLKAVQSNYHKNNASISRFYFNIFFIF